VTYDPCDLIGVGLAVSVPFVVTTQNGGVLDGTVGRVPEAATGQLYADGSWDLKASYCDDECCFTSSIAVDAPGRRVYGTWGFTGSCSVVSCMATVEGTVN
jgi:hypothetical protein